MRRGPRPTSISRPKLPARNRLAFPELPLASTMKSMSKSLQASRQFKASTNLRPIQAKSRIVWFGRGHAQKPTTDDTGNTDNWDIINSDIDSPERQASAG